MKKMMLAAALIAGTAQGQNLLNNPSFEGPIVFDGSDLTEWNAFFGGPPGTFLESFNDTGATPLSGANAHVTTIQGDLSAGVDGFNAFTGLAQRVDGLSAGAPYEFSIFARSNGNVTNGAEFRIEWIDAGGAIIGDQFALNTPIQDALTSDYELFSLTAIAPAGAVAANAVLAVQSFLNDGFLADTSVAWDDASFVLVPSPASAALLGLGGLAAARRRR
ncbi:MAG: hypothetical protein AAGF47_02880 [Planctomycetota bacterium]